ncbi:predicted protein [Histoplasma mississippiense (nom. inval.)]|uniref:predicted protein n=1 Tax=Ajellomyces capsulatus (strain NAm1 / WU24) TaxID=2059318 RepID=UPI000157D48B|nr:predicted protein [Histoplasma mississippiense (nom. inval.)]EDN05085.1 predicted protein [Histoplasma mississippiense (nom. inval.)]
MRPLAAHPESTPQILRKVWGRSGEKFNKKSFCYAELKTTEEEFLENLTAGRVKTYFDWVKNTHQNSIKAASAFDSYWRVLKILYVERTGHGMDSGMEQICLNYKNVVIKRWGLRRQRRRGTSGTKDDVYRILHAHWTWCTKAYADEKQQLYIAADILLSFISSGRLVSLFNTRIKTGDAKAGDGQSKRVLHTVSKSSTKRTNRRHHRPRATGATPDHYSTAGSRIGQHGSRPTASEKHNHMSNDTDFDSGYVDEESDSTSGSSEESLFGELVRENDTDTESSAESVESGCTSDTSADNDLSELGRFIEDMTDDEYDAGPEKTGAIVWWHISFHIIRSPVAGRPNILLAKVTLLHTKGEDKKLKTFIISHNPEPLLDLLRHLLSMAIDDEIFAPEFEKLEDIYWYLIPSYLDGMSLKIKAEMLDVPVFRQPERTGDGLTQYVWRCSLINAINNKAPSSVQDQVADHESNAVQYYLDTVIHFNLEAAAMELPSNDVVQKAAHGLFLNADATAPTELTDELKRKITENPKIIELTERSKELTQKLRAMGFRSVPAAQGKTPLYEEKMKVVSRLNRSKVYLHSKLIERQRRWHFRHADMERFNQRLRNSAVGESLDECPAPPPLQISERRRVVELTCAGTQELTEDEQFARRCACIIVWFKLQRRKEVQRRGRHKKQQPSQRDFQPNPPLDTVRAKESIPAKLGEKQCPFCVADISLPWGERLKVRERTNKFWNHIESVHREELKAYSTGQKHCGICKVQGVTFTPPSIMEFKSHTLSVHGPRLRP